MQSTGSETPSKLYITLYSTQLFIKDRYAYVGKTEEDFRSRFLSHPRGTNKYSILNQNSTTLTSFALCVLKQKYPNKLFYLAEQVLLCLLGTYRSEILNAVSYMNQTTIDDQSKPPTMPTLFGL